MTNKKIWMTKKLITIYPTYKGDTTDPKSLKCDTHNSTVVGRHHEVESIARYGDYVFIKVLHNNQYWYTWVKSESLKPAPIRYMVRPSERNPHKWEVWNTVWHQKAIGEYDTQAIAQAHATNLNITFKVGKIGAAWFSIRDGSWTIELIPVDCLELLRKIPFVDMHLRVSKHGEYSPLTLTQEESLALNSGVCLTFHPHRNPYEVRIALFKIMRKRYGIEPCPPT
jgi:hypothetical protein